MAPSGRRALERLFLTLCNLVPRRLASHALFLLRHKPDMTDGWGYHIRPIHYYEPLPDFREISAEQLRRRRIPQGINFDLRGQVGRVRSLQDRFGAEIRQLAGEVNEPYFGNPFFGGLDAALYYAIIRDCKPARIFEIGGGYSTRIAARASSMNALEGRGSAITVIEPYPEPRLTDAGIAINLVRERVEKLDRAMFGELERKDILFIDSSHVVRCGGDVVTEVLEILPSLKPGVWVHIHDVFFPFDYPVDWIIGQRLAFNEQYLVEAFLAFNDRFAIEFSNSWLAADFREEVAGLVPTPGDAGRPASLWLSTRH